MIRFPMEGMMTTTPLTRVKATIENSCIFIQLTVYQYLTKLFRYFEFRIVILKLTISIKKLFNKIRSLADAINTKKFIEIHSTIVIEAKPYFIILFLNGRCRMK